MRCGWRLPHADLDSRPRLSTQTLLRRTASVPHRLLGAAEGEKPCPIDLEHNLQGTKALHGDQPATTRPGRGGVRPVRGVVTLEQVGPGAGRSSGGTIRAPVAPTAMMVVT